MSEFLKDDRVTYRLKILLLVFLDSISVAVSYYVLQGIMTLADKLENQEMKEKGRLVIYIYAGALLGSAVVSLISSLVRAEGVMAVVASVLSVIALIAGIVGYVCYIMYLHKAQKMLS